MKISSALAAFGAVAAMLCANGALAQNIKVNLVPGGDTLDRYYDRNETECSLGTPASVPPSRPYVLRSVTISQAGTYTIRDLGPQNRTVDGDGRIDGGMGIYDGFSPPNLAINCIGSVDEITDVVLDPGTYDIVLTSYWSHVDWSDPAGAMVEFSFTGPAAVSFGASTPPSPAPIPTLSEWAMILLGVALAGGAALTIQRRRTA